MEIRKVTADSAEEAELVISLRRLLQGKFVESHRR